MEQNIHRIITFWFGYINQVTVLNNKNPVVKRWFAKDNDFDQQIKEKFQSDIEVADKGDYDAWKQTPKGSLALILLFDQFVRNIYRNTPKSFFYDQKALDVCLSSIEKGFDRELMFIYRVFMYMPLMHSEDIEVQKKSMVYFEQLFNESNKLKDVNVSYYANNLNYAKKHFEIIEMFGRYPHRNGILNRTSTPEEEGFLKLTGSSF